MPRGRWVSHKGRSRHFTSPEELQRENDEKSSEEEGSSSEEGEDGAAASTSSKKDLSKRNRDKKMPTSSEESEEESDEGPARDSKKGVASLIEIENPNRVVKKLTNKVTNLKLDDAPVVPQLSRREREQIEQEQARLRYEKLHAEGKTDEAKADLERLAIIRQQRAEAAAKRLAEKAAQEQKKAAKNKA